MIAGKEMVDPYVAGCDWAKQEAASVFAPANIALCKYWGKRDRFLNLPVTDSLSISLGKLGSHCALSLAEADTYVLNGSAIDKHDPFATRLCAFLDLFRGPAGYQYHVEAVNTVATAAGFASSASGFAAVVMALNALHGWSLEPRVLSIFARMGSGSACRSLWNGFVHWHAGRQEDGSDCFAEPLASDWDTLRVGLLTVHAGKKDVSSREAMNRTVATSSLYAGWPQQVQQDLATQMRAIAAGDFALLGACAEQNALAMHATMMAARPPVLYWHAHSVSVMHTVWEARSEGIPVYFTMDAGPNVKLLFEQKSRDAVQERFPALQVTDPWGR
ncbi:MAG: diphosphomevalonate decarboxylase [Kiritimatiellia bacterium]